VKEASAHADEDKRKRESIELRNEADNFAYQIEKTLKDNGDKVPADVKTDVEARLGTLREALKTEDTERIRTAMNELRSSATKIGEAMYASQQATTPPEGEPAGATAGKPEGEKRDDTIEGEFTEKN
jgi:molecular chaperone DnaK